MRTLTLGGIADMALAAAAGAFALRFAVIAAFLASMSEGRLGAADLLVLTAAPLAFAAASALLLAMRAPSRAALGGGAVVLAALLAAAGSRPPDVATRANALGLASQAVNSVIDEDASRDRSKDSYPPCRARTNSLGFRDEEPPSAPVKGRRCVLLVGDSFVWGAGIPVNEETLGYALREELERAAPGGFTVMSAAHRGLGLYGYDRFIEALSGLCRPAIVVVGYLGTNDHDPFDPQFLLDHLPRRAFARNLVLNLGAAQHIHDASVTRSARIWSRAGNRDRFAALTRGIAERARERGTRMIFLSYFEHPALPRPIEALDLPEGLRYSGGASDLWYAKDSHPKPKLNRVLAKDLAAKITRKET